MPADAAAFAPLSPLRVPALSGRAPSSKLKAPSYDEAGIIRPAGPFFREEG